MSDLLWPDERLDHAVKEYALGYMARRLLMEMRWEFETEISRLQQRIAELEAAQAGPRVEPAWSQAPKWAMYWAVDTNGRAHWFQEQPFREDGEWYTADGNGEWRHLKFETSGMVALPLGCDWRTTLTARPAAVPGAGGGGGNE